MLAFGLLLTSAFLHALWNSALKRSKNKAGVSLAIMLSATLLNALFCLFTATWPPMSVPLVGGTLIAGICEGFYFLLLSRTYEKQNLGVAYTLMRGGAMVLVWWFSSFWLKEALTLRNMLAGAVVLFGIACVQKSFRAREFFETGMGSAYLCAFFITGYHLAYGVAVRTGAAPSLVFTCAMTCGLFIYVACDRSQCGINLTKALREEMRLTLAGGLACGLSFLLFLTALQHADPGRAISVRNTSVMFGALLALSLGEKLSRIQWLGVACVAAGALGFL